MEPTDKMKKKLRSYCAFLLQEYELDYPPTDPVIPVMYAIHKDMQLNNEKNQEIAALVAEAYSKMKPQVFHFNSAGEAFRFQLGIAIKWILCGGIVLGFAWLAAWYWSLRENINEAKMIIESSGKASELMRYVKKDEAGYYFIEFIAARRGSRQYAKEFVRVDKNAIRVYLGKDSTLKK